MKTFKVSNKISITGKLYADKCAICGKPLYAPTEALLGNNPWPVVKEKNAVCCDNCNWAFVVPARFNNDDASIDNQVSDAKATLERLAESEFTDEEVEMSENMNCPIPNLYLDEFFQFYEVHDVCADRNGYVVEATFQDVPLWFDTITHAITLGPANHEIRILSEEITTMLEEALDDWRQKNSR